MPFRSEAQRRKMWSMADKGEISRATVQEFADATPKGQKLPYHVKKQGLSPRKPRYIKGK